MKTQTYTRTKKVSAQKSLSTNRTFVKMSRVTYGFIDGESIIMSTKPTKSVMNSIIVFADKNNLRIDPMQANIENFDGK